jgi:putative tryptophan/tyrosine transport system substrate-binding protein
MRFNRREFITLFGGAAAAWPLAARAQRSSVPVIGWLGSFSSDLSRHLLAAFRDGLKESGYVEGQNVLIEYRWADNQYDRLPMLASELVSRQVTVIVAAGGEPPAVAAKRATSSIPIVFSALDDPVRLGLVATFNRPGGNATGMSIFNAVTNSKRLQLAHELVPKTSAIGLLISSNIPDMENQIVDARNAARAFGLELHVLNADAENDFPTAFESLIKRQCGALVVHPTAFVFSRRAQLVMVAAHYSVPTIYPAREFAAAGGLISYGIQFADLYRRVGEYTARILKGEEPGDLPVQQPTKFELVINLKAAKTLGLEIPPTLLALADEVIE